MEKESFDNFVNNLKNTFEEVVLELTSSEARVCQTNMPEDVYKVIVIVGITGKNKGRILFECSKETAERFTIAMNEGEPLTDQDDPYSYIVEFANIVCGKASTRINNLLEEKEIKITPPVLLSGKNLQIITPKIISETSCFSLESGVFTVNVGFEDK